MNFFLSHCLGAWQPLGYIAVFIGMSIEGDAVLLLAAFVTRQGLFNPFIMVGVLFIGVIVGDLIWYWVGEHWLNKFRITRWINRIARPFDNRIMERPFQTIFISKFMYGFNHAVLLRAGALKIDKSKFMKIDAAASIFWIMIVGGLGYFSGSYFLLVRHYVHNAEFIVLFVIIAYFVLDKIFTEILKRIW